MYSQNVTNDADGPHVSAKSYLVEVHHFGGDEFGGAEQNLELLARIELSRQPEVYYLDAVPRLREAQNIFRLKSEMTNGTLKS